MKPLARLDFTILACLIILAASARILPSPRNVDDSFITFRYSRNIIEGQGFVYNPGERVLGTTTPLFTVVMAGIGKLVGGEDFAWYALTVSAAADAVTCILLFLLLRRLTSNRWLAALLGALWAISPLSVTFAIGGMETSVVILWMVLATYCFITDRWRLVGVAAALGLLTRIDAGLWIAPLLLFQLVEHWRKDRRLPLGTWAAFVVTSAPWFLFSIVYFGTPLSRSISAKTTAYLIEPGQALIRLIQQFSTPFFEFDTFGSIGAMVGSIAYLLLYILGIITVARRFPRLLPFVLYAAIYFIVFSIANPLIFRWYLAPPMPAFMFGILAGVFSVFGKLKNLRIANLALVILAVLWITTSINGWTLSPDHGPARPAPKMAWHKIELLYEQVALMLRDKYGVDETTVLASADIGAVGYFSRAHIIDTVGLVTPKAASYYPFSPSLVAEGNYAIPPALILDTHPEYLVTMESFVRLGLEEDATFKRRYGDPIERFPFEVYGSDMRVYKRRE